ncbi:SpoIIE family protein phosphatase [Nocardia otitidiscaviarum]|uniref:SpoIIE family protein phosphatase n=1 Tax=Nocardia otitidiscaviarum TaxID=1823 RepID=UPI002457E39D|nr:SpoIIE family protein phosphatase [Nocardia otitidiscaviarum]
MTAPPPSGPAIPPDLRAAIALGGEMGRRLAEFDWAAHPLGVPADWPAELRTSVAVALTSRFPILLWLDARELFLVYNDAYLPILGDRHPAALGRAGREVWWDIWESIGPMLTSVVDTGAATWSDDLMLPLLTEGRPQERYFTFSYSPLVAAMGTVCGVFCAVTETTERVLGERRLHALNAVNAAVMESRTVRDAVRAAVTVCAQQASDLPFIAVYAEDADGRDLTLHGASAAVSPLLPPSLSDLAPGAPARPTRADSREIADLAAVVPGLAEAFPDGAPERALVLPLGEGAIIGALVVGISPRRPLDEQYRGFCRLLADQLASALAAAVSYEQQCRRADALAEIDRAKTAFLTNVSHEFRTPLTLLLGPLDDALAEADAADAVLGDRLHTARRNAGRLLRLVDSLLDFSRIEAGRATARPRCLDVGVLTAHIAASFAELCQRAGLTLELDCDTVAADIDPDMWETVVLNLLSNAVKFTFDGSIRVEVRAEEPDLCRITVRDTGIGIDPNDLDRLFDRFYRADNARGRSVEGSGIGLSLVRGLVELQHGTVAVESTPGRGTAVIIRLPRSDATRTVESGMLPSLANNPYVTEAGQWLSLPAEPRPRGGRRELVLIADDNADMRNHLDRVLSVRWDTMVVGDGESALRAVREHRPDAVVADVMMPGLDGFELLAAVRAEPELASTPVLLLSARAGREAAREGFAGGADDYVAKPFTSQELVDRVAARLAAAARERAGRLRGDALARAMAAVTELDTVLRTADTVTAVLAALLESLSGAGVRGAAIALLDAETDCVRTEYINNADTPVRARQQVLALDSPLPIVEVIRTGRLVVVGDAHSGDGTDVIGGVADHRSSVAYPLRDGADRVVGAVALLWAESRTFAAEDLDVLARTVTVTQTALSRVRIMQREHRIAVEFQDQLLDLDRRSTAAAVAAVYQPAGEAMRVGGDWYLVVPFHGSDRLGISVGDVVGHGLPAAVVMSKLRAGVAAGAITAADPTTVLELMDRYAAVVPGSRCATVTYAVVDSRARTLEYTCAGHPYPLVLGPDGAAGFLTGGRRTPVAVPPPERGGTGRADIAPGSVILLYTDGVIERPGENLDQGFARLRAALAECADLPVAEICSELLRRLAPPHGYTDDVVLLAVRPVHATARSFAAVLPAAPAQVPGIRDRLRRWLTAHDVAPDREYDILLAVGEALANAIEHGGGFDPRATVTLEAFRHGKSLVATISDAGRWIPAPTTQIDSERGRGFTLMNGLADGIDTVRTPNGTRVTLRFENCGA